MIVKLILGRKVYMVAVDGAAPSSAVEAAKKTLLNQAMHNEGDVNAEEIKGFKQYVEVLRKSYK